MKHTRVIVTVLLLLVVWFGCGCKTTRKLQKQKASYEQSAATLRDSIKKVSSEKDSLHQKEVQTLKAAGVKFRDKPVPVPVYYPDSVGRDSLLKVIAILNGQVLTSNNQIEILSDGTIKASGDIAEAHSTVEQKDKEIFRLKQANDSLIQVSKKDTASIKINTEETNSSKKTSTFDWFRWLFFLIGFASGIAFYRYRKQIFSLFTKIPFMKSLFIFLMATLMLASCSNTPDDVVHKETSKQTGWKLNEAGTANVPVIEVYYTISPTWGQAFGYAYEGGYGTWVLIGILLLAAAGWVFYCRAKEIPIVATWDPKYKFVIAMILLLASLASFYGQPGYVKWNNDKPIPATQYNEAMARDGNTQTIWDSLRDNHLILGGDPK